MTSFNVYTIIFSLVLKKFHFKIKGYVSLKIDWIKEAKNVQNVIDI